MPEPISDNVFPDSLPLEANDDAGETVCLTEK